MKKDFIPYEQALALKELGFDEPCFGYYTGDKKHLLIRPNMFRRNEDLNDVVCTAPTFSQAFGFFRDKYGCCGYTNIRKNIVGKYFLNSFSKYDTILGVYNTWEEAELECLKEMIKVVKK